MSFIYFSDVFIKLKIEAGGLNEEQKKDVYDMLTPQVTTFMKTRNYSKHKVLGVRALIEFLERGYNLSQVALDVGSLIISLNCKTLKGLDQLWKDYCSGHLNKVAERYLVTDKMKRKLNLKTTIDEENYFNCRKVLMESLGEHQCMFFCSNIMRRVGTVMVYSMCVGLIVALACEVSSLCQRSVILISLLPPTLVVLKNAWNKFSLSIRLTVVGVKGASLLCLFMYVEMG